MSNLYFDFLAMGILRNFFLNLNFDLFIGSEFGYPEHFIFGSGLCKEGKRESKL